MPLPLLSQRAPARLTPFGFLWFGVIALLASAISYCSLQGPRAFDTSDGAGTIASPKSPVPTGLDSTASRNDAVLLRQPRNRMGSCR